MHHFLAKMVLLVILIFPHFDSNFYQRTDISSNNIEVYIFFNFVPDNIELGDTIIHFMPLVNISNNHNASIRKYHKYDQEWRDGIRYPNWKGLNWRKSPDNQNQHMPIRVNNNPYFINKIRQHNKSKQTM